MAGNPLDSCKIQSSVRGGWFDELSQKSPQAAEWLTDFCGRNSSASSAALRVHCNKLLIKDVLGRDIGETAFKKWIADFRSGSKQKGAI